MRYECKYFIIAAGVMDDIGYLCYRDQWPRFVMFYTQLRRLYIYLLIFR
jgi:hypothetical protein